MSVDLSALQDAAGALLAAAIDASPATALADVTAVLGATDPDADYPYLMVGEDIATDASTQCVDGSSVVMSIHNWTKEAGFTQSKKIDAAVNDLFDDNKFAVPGHLIISCFYRTSRFIRDPARGIRHGITEFDVDIEVSV